MEGSAQVQADSPDPWELKYEVISMSPICWIMQALKVILSVPIAGQPVPGHPSRRSRCVGVGEGLVTQAAGHVCRWAATGPLCSQCLCLQSREESPQRYLTGCSCTSVLMATTTTRWLQNHKGVSAFQTVIDTETHNVGNSNDFSISNLQYSAARGADLPLTAFALKPCLLVTFSLALDVTTWCWWHS